MAKGITLQELDKDLSNSLAMKSEIGSLLGLRTKDKSNLVAAVNELFTDVSDGKNAVAAAITGKGVQASGSDSFAQLASKISSIRTGSRSDFYIYESNFKTGTYTRPVLEVPLGGKFLFYAGRDGTLRAYAYCSRDYDSTNRAETYLRIKGQSSTDYVNILKAIAGFNLNEGVNDELTAIEIDNSSTTARRYRVMGDTY